MVPKANRQRKRKRLAHHSQTRTSSCMVQAGLDESTIVLAIEQKPTAAFDTSPDALTELKKTGVSQAIMNAMLRKGALPRDKSGETSQERRSARAQSQRNQRSKWRLSTWVNSTLAWPLMEPTSGWRRAK